MLLPWATTALLYLTIYGLLPHPVIASPISSTTKEYDPDHTPTKTENDATIPFSSAVLIEASVALQLEQPTSVPAIPLPTNATEFPEYNAVRQLAAALPILQQRVELFSPADLVSNLMSSFNSPDSQTPTQRRQSSMRVLIVGDSITQGFEGDWTWRYRIWQWFLQNSISVQMVGPYTGTKANPPPEPPQPPPLYKSPPDPSFSTNGGYARGVDPAFLSNSNHFAVWGRAAAVDKGLIQGVLQQHSADLMLLMLGFNDMGWFYSDAGGTLDSILTLITNARAVNPNIKIAVANVPHRTRINGRTDLVSKTQRYNQLLPEAISRISTSQSPLHVVDIANVYQCGEDGCPSGYDGLHPNNWGEYQIASAFSTTLVRDFGIGSSPLQVPSQSDSSLSRNLPTPANVRAFSSPQGVTVTWDPVYGAYSYDVRAQVDGVTAAFSAGNVPTNRWDSQWPLEGWQYTVSIRANAGDNIKSDWSASVSAVATPQLPPPPTNIKVRPTEYGVSITWDPPSGGLTGTIVRYNVLYWDWDPNACQYISGAAFSSSPAIIDTLTPGRNYAIFLVAWNENGQGLPAGSFNIVPGAGTPSVPSGLRVDSIDPTTAHLTWGKTQSAGGYKVWYRNVNLPGSELELLWNVTNTVSECTDQYFLFPGTWNYAFALSAFNGDLESDTSSEVLAPSPALGGGSVPTCPPEPSWCPGGGSVSVPPVGGGSTSIIGGTTSTVTSTFTVIDGTRTLTRTTVFTTVIGGTTTTISVSPTANPAPTTSVIGGTTITPVGEDGRTSTTVIGGTTITINPGEPTSTPTGFPKVTNGRCTGDHCINGRCVGPYCASFGCTGNDCYNGYCIGVDCTQTGCIGSDCEDGVCFGLNCFTSGCVGIDCVPAGAEDGDGSGDSDGDDDNGGHSDGHCIGIHCISIGCWGLHCLPSGLCTGSSCSLRTCSGPSCYGGTCARPPCTSFQNQRGGGPDAPEDPTEPCTTSREFPTCTTKYVIVTSVFPDENSRTTSTRTTSTCHTVTACTGFSTAVTTTSKSSTTIETMCAPTSCGSTCIVPSKRNTPLDYVLQSDNSTYYDPALNRKNSTLSIRDFPGPGSGDWEDFYTNLKRDSNTFLLDNDAGEDGTITAIKFVRWGTKPQNLVVQDLYGCAALICHGHLGALVAHFWEWPSLMNRDNRREKDVTSIVDLYFGSTVIGPQLREMECIIFARAKPSIGGNEPADQETLTRTDHGPPFRREEVAFLADRVALWQGESPSIHTYVYQANQNYRQTKGYGKAAVVFDPSHRRPPPGSPQEDEGILLPEHAAGYRVYLQGYSAREKNWPYYEFQIWRATANGRNWNVAILVPRGTVISPCDGGLDENFQSMEEVPHGSDVTEVGRAKSYGKDQEPQRWGWPWLEERQCLFEGGPYQPLADETVGSFAGFLACENGFDPTACFRPSGSTQATTCGGPPPKDCGRLGVDFGQKVDCPVYYQLLATCFT